MRHYKAISRKLSKRNVFVKLVVVVEITKLNDLNDFA